MIAGDSDDRFRVESYIPGSELTIDAGDGDDRINIVPTIVNPRAATGQIRILGGGGANDVLNIQNDVARNVGPYTLTRDSVRRSDILPVDYDDLDRVMLNVDSGDNEVIVDSTAPDTPMIIRTGRGDDRIRVNGPESVVTIDAGTNNANGDEVTLVGTNAADVMRLQGREHVFWCRKSQHAECGATCYRRVGKF